MPKSIAVATRARAQCVRKKEKKKRKKEEKKK